MDIFSDTANDAQGTFIGYAGDTRNIIVDTGEDTQDALWILIKEFSTLTTNSTFPRSLPTSGSTYK